MRRNNFIFTVILAALPAPVLCEQWRDLMRQSDTLFEHQLIDSAVIVAQSALTLAVSTLGPADTTIGNIHFQIGRYHFYGGRYGEAEAELLRALETYGKQVPPNHPLVTTTVGALGLVYANQGKFLQAETLYVNSLSGLKQTVGEENPDYANDLANLADLYVQLNRLSAADSLLGRALQIRRKILDPQDAVLAQTYNQIGNVARASGRYQTAVESFQNALAILESAPQKDLLEEARTQSFIANVHGDFGEFSAAESLYTESANLFRQSLGAKHPEYAAALYNLGLTYLNIGDYFRAEPLLQSSLSIFEENYGPDYFQLADVLNTLGALYDNIGSYDEAEEYYDRALRVRQTNFGSEHIDVTYDLNNLANLAMERGQLTKADSLFRRCLEIREQSEGPQHPDLELPLENLALVSLRRQDFHEAENYIKRATAILTSSYGSHHPYVSRSLSTLATICSRQGEYKLADSLFRSALSALQAAYPEGHPDVALCLESFSEHLRASQQLTDALDYEIQAFAMRHKLFELNASFLTEDQALEYAQYEKTDASACVSIFSDIPNGLANAFRNRVGGVVLTAKGSVSDNLFRRQQVLLEESDQSQKLLLRTHRGIKYKLAQLYCSGANESAGDQYQREVDSLNHDLAKVESELGRQSGTVDVRHEGRVLTCQEVGNLLPADAVLVDFFKYAYRKAYDDSVTQRYLAVIVRANDQSEIISLGDATTIEPVVGKYRRHMLEIAASGHFPTPVDQDSYDPIGRELYDLLVKPLGNLTSLVQTLVLAPDGALNLISFAGLLDSTDHYLIESNPLRFLSAGRDLLRLNDSMRSNAGLLAMGDPQFDASVTERQRASQGAAGSDSHARPTELRGFESKCLGIQDIHALPLPGTRAEIAHVNSSWTGKGSDSAYVYLGASATEDRFKSASQGKRILHLATHGYFLSEPCARAARAEQKGHGGQNPLLISGLLFAGCNLHGIGSDSLGIDDGILSALEVSALDLRGTEMIVLSACETGLGEIAQSEGVFGIRRAFEMAGGRRVVSSLWPVFDSVTVDIMDKIYRNRSGTISTTIRNAELTEIKKCRSAGIPDHPFSWAPFMAIGD